MIVAIAEQHLEQASFLWLQRDLAAVSHSHGPREIADLDARIEAHLHGLYTAGSAVWQVCAQVLDRRDAGEVFTEAALALSLEELARLEPLLDAAGGSAALLRGLVSALGFTPFARIERALLGALLEPEAGPELNAIGIAAAAVHRRDPGEVLRAALSASNTRLAARALRAVGELGLVELLDATRARCDDGDPTVRFWAAWSCRLLGDDAATTLLWDMAANDGPLGDRALAIAARGSDPQTAQLRLARLTQAPTRARAAVLGFGALGDPGHLPRVIEMMRAPDVARAAGAAFTMITGVPLRPGLEGSAPEDTAPTDDPADEAALMHVDELLPWPDVEAVRRTFAKLKLARGVRHIAGRPLDAAWLDDVIANGPTQAMAHGAALERALSNPGRPLVEVRARQRG